MDPHRYTTGEERFGSKIEPPYTDFELYDKLAIERLDLRIKMGLMLDGGPDLDIAKLERLRKEAQQNSTAASAELKELMRYQLWFRYMQAMNVRDEPAELNPNG